jgi:hypothetical protein
VVDSFYRFSSNPATARYALSFTDLGPGNGNYLPEFNGANGKVYRYVAPVNGIKQGQYEPVQLLVTPKRQQLFSVGTEYTIDARNTLKSEVALSNYDVNTYSSRNAGDDAGIAARVQFTHVLPMNRRKGRSLTAHADYEHVDQKFRPLERLRYVEFTREWGLPLLVQPSDENILRLSAELKDKKDHALVYQFMNYQRGNQYKGYQNLLRHTAVWKGWTFNNQYAETRFRTASEEGSFLRPVIDVSKVLKSWSAMRLGFRYALERNKVMHKQTDSLSPLSFSFDTYTAYLRSDENKRNRFGLNFFTRSDQYPMGKGLIRGDRSYNFNATAELLQSTRHQLLFNATYRILQVYDKRVSQQDNDRTILGRTEYLVNEWKGLLTGNVLYELGTGQEQRRDFSYLEVPAGQGEFTWIDYNNDGVQQLNEFETALFQDQARFVRILIPTNSYVKANFTTLNYSMTLNPKAVWNRADISRFQKFLARFNWQSSLQKNKKSTARGDFEFNPFKGGITDTALITLNTSLLNTLSFNRYSATWGIDLSHLQNTGKALLTYGYESRKTAEWIARARWTASPSLSFDVQARDGVTALYTPSFDNRNYELDLFVAEPRITFIRGTVFRIQGGYKLEQKKNKGEYGGERSVSNALNLESKYNVLQNSSVNARLTYDNISWTAPAGTSPGSTVGYIMLEGLLPGNNYLWSVDYTRRLLNSVELNFQYEGRKPGETRTIHTGRATLRALF